MQARRVFGLAAVWADGVAAGTIDSRNGSATLAPTPCRNVRRDTCFFMMNMTRLLSSALLPLHLKRRALDDPQDDRREAIVAGRGASNDRANGRHISVLHRPPE